MKKVLIITYYWPPAGGPGVQRWLKFVKYLRACAWEPVVLTVKNGTYPARDETLEADVPYGIAIYKTRASGPFRWYNLLKRNRTSQVPVALIGMHRQRSWFEQLALYIRSNFFIPDARKGWNGFALKAIPVILKEHPVDVVVTSGPPQSTHLIGKELARRYGLPWIADFRDPWTTVYYNDLLPRTRRTKRIDRSLEDGVLKAADAVITVSRGMKEEFQDRAKHIEVIYNGYDETDLPEGEALPAGPPFMLLHTGHLAPNQHVPALWDALARLCHEDAGFAERLCIRLVGNTDGSILRYLAEAGLAGKVEQQGYIPHDEAVRMMGQASLLLVVIPEAPGNRSIVTGKIFEYLASGIPVLGIGPLGGDAAEILAVTGRAPMLEFNDNEGIRETILNIYRQWEANGSSTPRLETTSCRQFSRRNATAQLARILDEVKKG